MPSTKVARNDFNIILYAMGKALNFVCYHGCVMDACTWERILKSEMRTLLM